MDYSDISTKIVDSIELGDHFYDDVWCVANGKLRDRSPQVVKQLGAAKIKKVVSYATKGLVSKLPVAEIASMAKYYREKYSDLSPDMVKTVE